MRITQSSGGGDRNVILGAPAATHTSLIWFKNWIFAKHAGLSESGESNSTRTHPPAVFWNASFSRASSSAFDIPWGRFSVIIRQNGTGSVATCT